MVRWRVCLIALSLSCLNAFAADPTDVEEPGREITMEEFLSIAVKNDTVFEEILARELELRYFKDSSLPARDLVLSVKGQYGLFLEPETTGPEASISLEKLFPYTGTEISAGYQVTRSAASGTASSGIELLISVPIAENAFGRGTRIYDRALDFTIDLARHQITEAYEDYLANIITLFYSWYSASENLKIGESSYNQNMKLFDNIKKRQKSNIALPIDVNKVNVQILAKKESLISLREKHDNIMNLVKQAMRYKGGDPLVPADPFVSDTREISFKEEYDRFFRESRTCRMLKILEEKGMLDTQKGADDLLPSADMFVGYEAEGTGTSLREQDSLLFAGVSLSWPFPGQTERALYETSKIGLERTRLSNRSRYAQLDTDLRNLFSSINREKELIKIAEEKISLSEEILKDETKNYSFGKVTLNDFIDAVNRLDENRFNLIQHSIQLKILMTEWNRLTDRLVDQEKIIPPRQD